MNKERAKQIMDELKEECSKYRMCLECPFYIGNNFNSNCVFSAEDNENGYDGMPKDWIIEEMPNLK